MHIVPAIVIFLSGVIRSYIDVVHVVHGVLIIGIDFTVKLARGICRNSGRGMDRSKDNKKIETLHILRVDCEDREGLVYAVTGVLFRHGFNITSNREFVDSESGHFFMRTEFTGAISGLNLEKELLDVLPGNSTVELKEREKKRVVIMVTKEPHCLGDLMISHAFGDINAVIQAVISNHSTLGEFVGQFNIPFHHVSHKGLSRQDHEDRVLEVLERYDPEYIVLAKYMRVLTPGFVGRYRNRIINIHHSFLPAFAGADPYTQAFRRGVKIIGATAHFVNDYLDEGPIITQGVIPIDHKYGPNEMRQAGRDVEKIVLAKALRLVFDDKVFINGNKTIVME